jgi:hypothetical protein
LPTYVAEYKDDLASMGQVRFGQNYPYPVLIVLGLTGTLQGPSGSGTVVAAASDTMLLSTLVGRVFPVAKAKHATPGPVRVGRTSENDICIPEYSISKFHCHLALVGTEMRLVDSGSTNGTTVNGKRLAPRTACTLAGGETIVLGRFAFMYHRPHGFVAYLQTR